MRTNEFVLIAGWTKLVFACLRSCIVFCQCNTMNTYFHIYVNTVNWKIFFNFVLGDCNRLTACFANFLARKLSSVNRIHSHNPPYFINSAGNLSDFPACGRSDWLTATDNCNADSYHILFVRTTLVKFTGQFPKHGMQMHKIEFICWKQHIMTFVLVCELTKFWFRACHITLGRLQGHFLQEVANWPINAYFQCSAYVLSHLI